MTWRAISAWPYDRATSEAEIRREAAERENDFQEMATLRETKLRDSAIERQKDMATAAAARESDLTAEVAARTQEAATERNGREEAEVRLAEARSRYGRANITRHVIHQHVVPSFLELNSILQRGEQLLPVTSPKRHRHAFAPSIVE
jgi:hypothetical protein